MRAIVTDVPAEGRAFSRRRHDRRGGCCGRIRPVALSCEGRGFCPRGAGTWLCARRISSRTYQPESGSSVCRTAAFPGRWILRQWTSRHCAKWRMS